MPCLLFAYADARCVAAFMRSRYDFAMSSGSIYCRRAEPVVCVQQPKEKIVDDVVERARQRERSE